MNILHFHSSLTSGGVEAMITGLANTMAESEKVDICLMYKPKESDIFIKKLCKSINVFNLGKTKTGFSFSMPFKVAWFLARHKYDVVQLHGFFYYYVLAVLLLHKRTNFFYTVHNDAPLENTRWDKKIIGIKKRFFKWGWLHPITISDSSQESFEKLYPGCENIKIFNGISIPVISDTSKALIEEHRINPDTLVFINPGRICEQKNQLTLVKAFSRLIEDGYDVVLLIAGQCQNEEILSKITHYFNDRIKYLGEIDNIPGLLHYSDAMCLPSLWEGLPVVLLEALAVGCPSICSPVGGVPDIVKSGFNGLLSDDSSENKYYETLKRFLGMTKQEKMEMRHNCIASFSKFEIHNTVSEYLSAYKS